MICGAHGADGLRIIPETKMKEIGKPEKMLERSPGHYNEWIAMCKGGKRTGSNFVDHAGPLTEMVVLGNLAVRSSKRVEWDSGKMVCTNDASINKFVREPWRIF